ncbi:unnamed protein product [Mycena citricolor]|uniref:Reverse transcriptase Ty1/copia-type domain-containing protein n=1 Tax=Mycena citricolor TaxID=2018698 RepID=A0AAD2HB78_9AGAR|nr:unnamed protein product [Mycena citricolor]
MPSSEAMPSSETMPSSATKSPSVADIPESPMPSSATKTPPSEASSTDMPFVHDSPDVAPTEDVPMAEAPRSTRVRRIPARFLINLSEVEGGRILEQVLEHGDEIEIECEKEELPLVTLVMARAEASVQTAEETVLAALTDPIDDPDARDPQSLHEAEASIYWNYWLAALHEELESLKAKGVYEEVDRLPPGRTAVKSKWVLHLKRDQDGKIARFKARLVAKGFTQIPGQDFTYTFAPVARWEAIRLVLALAADYDMVLRQVDVKTAFLNGLLDEEIYMRMPSIVGEGFWRLLKGLYSLKQAGCQWYLELNSRLEAIGFKRTESDWSVYTRTRGAERSYLTASVDDMLIASSSTKESNLVVEELAKQFEITDNGEPKFHLGCSITRDDDGIRLDQKTYVESILRTYGMEKCNSVQTPMEANVRLSPATAEEHELVKDFPYAGVVGKCMYLTTCTRPDIAFTVRELARHMVSYGPAHVAAAKRLLRYLRWSSHYSILLGGNKPKSEPPTFTAMTDSDWGTDPSTRKSVSGFVILMGKSPIAWSSKQQAVVALSSCEAEYLATTHCAKDVLWFRNLFHELGFTQRHATTLFCDNQGTVACMHDPHAHSRMKHIAIREHFIRDCTIRRLIDVIHVGRRPIHEAIGATDTLEVDPNAQPRRGSWGGVIR